MFESQIIKFFHKKMIIVLSSIFFLSCTSKSGVEYANYEDVMQAPAIIPIPYLTVDSSENLLIGDVADVNILTDGGIIILDDQTMSIHLLSEDGEFLSSYSIQGRGPGEVQNPSQRLRTNEKNIIAIDDYFMFKISTFQVKNGIIEHITDIALETSISDFFLNKDHLVLKYSRTLTGEVPVDPIYIMDLKDIVKKKYLKSFPLIKN